MGGTTLVLRLRFSMGRLLDWRPDTIPIRPRAILPDRVSVVEALPRHLSFQWRRSSAPTNFDRRRECPVGAARRCALPSPRPRIDRLAMGGTTRPRGD